MSRLPDAKSLGALLKISRSSEAWIAPGVILAFALIGGCRAAKTADAGPVSSVTAIPTGDARCPAGGLDVKNGPVDQVICTPPGALVGVTDLPLGDLHCPGGGEEIDQGVDNGADGGVGGDGVLQAGEVTSVQYVCTHDSVNVGTLTPPDGPPGPYSINASGGSSSNGLGGSGAPFLASISPGSNGGHVKLFATGAADASFTLPTPPPLDPGSNPLNVTSDTTILWEADASGTGLSAGTYFSAGNSSSPIYLWTGSMANEVTSVTVAAGVTLTFDVYNDDAAQIIVEGTFINNGVLTTATLSDGVSKGGLYLTVIDYRGSSASRVSLKGLTPASTGTGGAGGIFEIIGASPFGGSVVNEGAIDVSGGDGNPAGGPGGIVVIETSSALFNTGSIAGHGGAGSSATGVGGSGGVVELITITGDINISGDIDTSGGAGGQTGGAGQLVDLAVQQHGSIRNSGAIKTSGGDVNAACTTTCVGGPAGLVEVAATGGDIVNAGSLTGRGGSGAAGSGGTGGQLVFLTQPGMGFFGAAKDLTTGSITVSGNLDARGGSGAAIGAPAGEIQFALTGASATPGGQELRLLGYGGGITLNGGDGVASGGPAGFVQAVNTVAAGPGGRVEPGGSVINTCPITAKGGAASNGNGGIGGHLELRTQDATAFADPVEWVINAGDVNLSGGAGTATGGTSGSVHLLGRSGVTNSGTITSIGGAASGMAGAGGPVGSVTQNGFFSDNGPVVNSGLLMMTGGASTGAGGVGGNSLSTLILLGTTASNTGTISANGGAGVAQGGNGAGVFIISSQGSSIDSGVVTTTAGIGTVPGTKGTLSVDGQSVAD